MNKQVLTRQDEDFPRWYQDVISKAELADNGPVRGTMVIRPWAYRIWELLQAEIDSRIKAAGADNAYFPLFIPEEFLQREADHVEGFSPELAVVTHGGGKELEAPVVVRPTSETIINHYFSKWIQSHRDLPMLLNQWCNVVRWELRPRLFLRTSEFLWQEGHTAHATESDAREYALRILRDVYADTMTNVLGVPVLLGRKTDDERFAGADTTWALEAMMRDGKALQMGTSHELGQNFARAFDIRFLGASGEQEYVWQTSWGSSTRMLGGLIMTHGDDAGLRLPPAIAPHQFVVMVVRGDDDTFTQAVRLADGLKTAGFRTHLDNRVDTSFGRRSTKWDLSGVPARIEVGPRELAAGNVTLVRRDLGTKEPLRLSDVVSSAPRILREIQDELLTQARTRRDASMVDVNNVDDALKAAPTGFVRIPYDVIRGEGVAMLAKNAVTVRCLQREDATLPLEHDAPGMIAIVARSY